MFTGLVRERGRLLIDPVESGRGGVTIRVCTTDELRSGLELGASVAVSGVCLTVTALAEGWFEAELSPETLGRTTLGELRADSEVNLEPSLRLGDPLGGHWVQGHVDGTTTVLAIEELTDHWLAWFELPSSLASFVVEKGSITLDGVSLTIANLEGDRFSVALIPHTLEVTTLGLFGVGDRCNVEVDVLAKYVARAMEPFRP